jgi:hypothetical protein
MALTLRYRSSRAEVWRWYWRAWLRPKGLWRYHAVIFACVAAIILGPRAQPGPLKGQDVFAALAFASAALIFLAAWPQIRFKSQERVLTLDERGVSTVIGSLSASVPWNRVVSIDVDNDTIVITGKNGNAFIVPNRAFPGDLDRAEVIRIIRDWHHASSAK